MNLLDFYENVVRCSLCNFKDDNILVDQSLGFIPHGFYSEGHPDQIKIMIVGQNPGVGKGNDFIETEETKDYKGRSHRKQAELSIGKHKQILRGEISWGSPFSRTIQSWLAYITGLSEKEVWKESVLTQALKCTTPSNSNPGDPRRRCAQAHIDKEIEFWRPELIVAAGKWAREALQWAGCTEFMRLYHPSGLKSNSRRNENRELLQDIREAYQRLK